MWQWTSFSGTCCFALCHPTVVVYCITCAYHVPSWLHNVTSWCMRASGLLLVEDFFKLWVRCLLGTSAASSFSTGLSDSVTQQCNHIHVKFSKNFKSTTFQLRLDSSPASGNHYFCIFLLLRVCHSTTDSDSICIFHKCLDNNGCAYYVCLCFLMFHHSAVSIRCYNEPSHQDPVSHLFVCSQLMYILYDHFCQMLLQLIVCQFTLLWCYLVMQPQQQLARGCHFLV